MEHLHDDLVVHFRYGGCGHENTIEPTLLEALPEDQPLDETFPCPLCRTAAALTDLIALTSREQFVSALDIAKDRAVELELLTTTEAFWKLLDHFDRTIEGVETHDLADDPDYLAAVDDTPVGDGLHTKADVARSARRGVRHLEMYATEKGFDLNPEADGPITALGDLLCDLMHAYGEDVVEFAYEAGAFHYANETGEVTA